MKMTTIALGVAAAIAGKCTKNSFRNSVLSVLKKQHPKEESVINDVKIVSLGDHVKDVLLSASLGVAVTSAVSLAGIPLTSAVGVGLVLGGTALADATLGAAWPIVKFYKLLEKKKVEKGFETHKKGLDILGYQEGMTKEQVKQAYHNAALIYHTDKGGEKDTFIEIEQAKEYLMEKGGYEYLQTKDGKKEWKKRPKLDIKQQEHTVKPQDHTEGQGSNINDID